MPATDAVELVNWVPDAVGVRCRKGYREWAINFAAPVRSILTWIGPDTPIPGGEYLGVPVAVPGKMFAATDFVMHDVTDSTDTPPSALALSGAPYAGHFSQAMLSNSAGAFLLACSEADGYFHYDGTTWVKPSYGAGVGQINNVQPTDLVYVLVWKRRVFFVEKNSTSVWYLPTDSITGAATEFDFGPLFKNGGHISYITRWTIDAGEGIDDFFVVVSSMGDVLLYQGTDPSTSGAFNLQGQWNIGQIPIGRRAHCQYGGDVLLLSASGIFPLSYITRGGSSVLQATGKEITAKINSDIGAALRQSFGAYGWQMLLHPSERLLIVSTPTEVGINNLQYVLSTTAVPAWCKFQGIPIIGMFINTGYAFVGTDDGRVLLILSGGVDNVQYGETVGTAVEGSIQPAFSYFDSPATVKHFLMARANFLAASEPSYSIGMNLDFGLRVVSQDLPIISGTQSAWDDALWDTDVWGGARYPFARWKSVTGTGYAGAAGLYTVTVGDTILTAIDYMFTVGGPL